MAVDLTGGPLWRGSLLPLRCEAAPKPATAACLIHRVADFATAAQPSGSKLPRHKKHRRSQGDKRQPWCSLIQAALLLRPMPLTVMRLLAVSSVKPLVGSHCFT